MESKKCPQCGTSFTGRSNRLYCGDTCKLRSFHQQKVTVPVAVVAVTPKRPTTTGITGLSVFKIELENTRLRLASDEKQRQLKVEERQRERQHEFEKQDREFEQELRRAETNLDRDRLKWGEERKSLLNEISTLANVSNPSTIELVKHEDEETKSSSALETVLWLAGGIALWKILVGNSDAQKQLPVAPKQPFYFPIAKPQPPSSLNNGSETVSETVS